MSVRISYQPGLRITYGAKAFKNSSIFEIHHFKHGDYAYRHPNWRNIYDGNIAYIYTLLFGFFGFQYPSIAPDKSYSHV